jgi:hypothetical protein
VVLVTEQIQLEQVALQDKAMLAVIATLLEGLILLLAVVAVLEQMEQVEVLIKVVLADQERHHLLLVLA